MLGLVSTTFYEIMWFSDRRLQEQGCVGSYAQSTHGGIRRCAVGCIPLPADVVLAAHEVTEVRLLVVGSVKVSFVLSVVGWLGFPADCGVRVQRTGLSPG